MMWNRIRKQGRKSLPFILLFFCLFIFGCGGGTEVGNPETPSVDAGGEKSLERYLKDEYATGVITMEEYGNLAGETQPVPPPDSEYDSIKQDYQASVQVSDRVVKSPGHIFAANGSVIDIVNIESGKEHFVESEIRVNGIVDSIYLSDGILAVFYTPEEGEGTTYDTAGPSPIVLPLWIPVDARMGLLVMDVTHPSHPGRIKEIVTDGRLVSIRMDKGRLEVVRQFLPKLPHLNTTYDGTENDYERVVAENRSNLESMTLSDLVPWYDIVDETGATVHRDQLVPESRLLRPDTANGGSITTLTVYDLKDDIPFESIGLVSDVFGVHLSETALYLASNRLTDPGEKPGEYETLIQKLDAEKMIYAGDGTVPGRFTNNGVMDERQGILRIATFEESAEIVSRGVTRIFSVIQKGESLETSGMLEVSTMGGKVRFMESYGVISSTLFSHESFIIDLSDPLRPKLAGTLTLSSSLDYIIPFDETGMIILGREVMSAGDMEHLSGLHLTMADLGGGSPEVLHRSVMEGDEASSRAAQDPESFVIHREKGLLGFPVETGGPGGVTDESLTRFNVYAFSRENGFQLKERIPIPSHPEVAETPGEDWTRGFFTEDRVIVATPLEIIDWNMEDGIDTFRYFDF